MADPENWVDPLHGYAYDSFNPDALMMMSVKDGNVVLPGGASYKILVIPGVMKVNPSNIISSTSVDKIIQLVNEGANVLIDSFYKEKFTANNSNLRFAEEKGIPMCSFGKGKFVLTPYWQSNFDALQVEKDVIIKDVAAGSLAFTHRKTEDADIYFVSNQRDTVQNPVISLRNISNEVPEIWDPVNGSIRQAIWSNENGRGILMEQFAAGQSLFFVFKNKQSLSCHTIPVINKVKKMPMLGEWKIKFDRNSGGPADAIHLTALQSWALQNNESIKYYSGTAFYRNSFLFTGKQKIKTACVIFDSICNIATIKVNGIDCGILWTPPYKIDIAKALRKGENKIEIEVTNTWHNRLIGDNRLPTEKRTTWTTAPFRLKDKPLQPAGIIGDVQIIVTH
jgi:hypothetical protein